MRRKYFFRFSYLSQHCRYNDETYGIYTIEDGEYFGEVKLRLTTSLRREMRLTIFILCISSATNINNGRPCICSEHRSLPKISAIYWTMIEGARGQNEANEIVRRKYFFWFSYLSEHCRYNLMMKLTKYIQSRTGSILARSN